jgi:hypothetical protein
MPLVRIDIMAGRSPEKIRELHGRVAALVAEILDTPIDRVHTYHPVPARRVGHRRGPGRRSPRRRGRGPARRR